MKNYFTQNFSSRRNSTFSRSLFLTMTLAVLAGCGGGGGVSSNPAASSTTSSTVTIATLSASQTTVSAGQSSIITAKVTDSTTGASLSGHTVSFSLPVTGSGAPALSVSPVVTDSSGNAVTVYTSGGGSPTDTVTDAILATLTNSSSQAVIITRSGQAATGNAIALTSPCAGAVVALNSCVLTATVKNASGNPVSGINVTFAMVAPSGTGAVLPPVAGVVVMTDSSGIANTIYTAGATAGRTDVITATITGGSAAIAIAD